MHEKEVIKDLCLLCSKETKDDKNKITGVFKNERLLYVISKGAGMNVDPDPGLPDTVCYNCVVNLNLFFSYQNRLRTNIMQLGLKHYIQVGDNNKIKKYKNFVLPEQVDFSVKPILTSTQHPDCIEAQDLFNLENCIKNNDNSGMVISDVRSEPNMSISGDIDNNTIRSDDQQYQQTGGLDSSYLLEPMFQTSENALDTESGGNIHTQNDKITAKRLAIDRTFRCDFCPKIYSKYHNLKRHMKKHASEKRKKAITEGQKFYNCLYPGCTETFDSQRTMKKHVKVNHEKSHEQIILKCKYCDKRFNHSRDLSWHEICCEAQENAKSERMKDKRRTRSQSMAPLVREGLESDNESLANTNVTDSLYSEKVRQFRYWKMDVDRRQKSRQMAINKDGNDNDNAESDYLSLDGSCNSGLSRRFSSVSESESSYDGRNEAKKRRKKHKEGRKKAKQRGEDYFACSFDINCSFGCTSLAQTMNHELNVHKALLLYFCKECREWFSTRENLIRHCKRHRAYAQCINCHQHFDNNYDLEHHMMLHHEKSYSCYFCRMSFLKKFELERHIAQYHANDTTIKKDGIISRNGQMINKLLNRNSFTGYKSKELIQNATPTNTLTRIRNVIHYKKKIGNMPNLCPNNEKPKEYWEYGSTIETVAINKRQPNINQDENVLNHLNDSVSDCDVPASSFTDYSGSPVMFLKEEIDDDVTYRKKSPHNSIDNLNLFSIDCLFESANNDRNENVTKINDGAPRKKRKINNLPIPITDKYIPPYDVLFERNYSNNTKMTGKLECFLPFRYPI